MKYHVGVPMVVQLTSAAKHDHYLLKEVHLPKDSTLAMDRGYVDIAQFQRLTEEGVCYATKMKKDLKYEVLESGMYVNTEGPLIFFTDYYLKDYFMKRSSDRVGLMSYTGIGRHIYKR